MDPVANIEEQREIAGRIFTDAAEPGDALRLAGLVLALDEWRRSGGFDPYSKEG